MSQRPNDHHMNRFYPSRVDSDDGPFLKNFSKCFESIRRTCRIDSYVDRKVLVLKELQGIDSTDAGIDSGFQNGLERDPVDSSSSESILKWGLRADDPVYGNSGLLA
ncbi:hypothetical protein PIB30_087504 [Stylosanthes scabra]|uniref:Uncharacterized protein n=1 Tax=Stylosanthes scabra TaxID=79078 RepID=A0ABU6STY9_9FABA|nr:hypothetical protein [Stylosanthes scabra]